MKRFISLAMTSPFGAGLRISNSTAMLAGSRTPRAITDITPTTANDATSHPWFGLDGARSPRSMASWNPAARVITTSVGMISTIFGMNRAENSARFMPKMVLIMPTLVVMTLAAGFQLAVDLGNLAPSSPNHGWLVASFAVVGVMSVIALGVLEPANIAVLFEMRKPEPDAQVIANLMKRFIYTAGILGLMQVATLVIMTRVATQ